MLPLCLSLRLSLLNNIFNQHLLDEVLCLSLSSTEAIETARRVDRMVFQSLLRETSAPLGHAAVIKRTSSASQFIHALTRRRRPPVRVLLSICVSMARARACARLLASRWLLPSEEASRSPREIEKSSSEGGMEKPGNQQIECCYRDRYTRFMRLPRLYIIIKLTSSLPFSIRLINTAYRLINEAT